MTVADVIPQLLETALAVGRTPFDSAREDVAARLTELHGQGADSLGRPRPGTDIYIDTAGVAAVVNTALSKAKWGAELVPAAQFVAHQERFARLISHTVPFSEVGRAFDLTLTPGAAEKVGEGSGDLRRPAVAPEGHRDRSPQSTKIDDLPRIVVRLPPHQKGVGIMRVVVRRLFVAPVNLDINEDPPHLPVAARPIRVGLWLVDLGDLQAGPCIDRIVRPAVDAFVIRGR
ncbi:hypothetical protein [Nonomuraea sp. NPDC003709]|uniref:hypothetical protein n=1 Tax=Nonomuraea sp. NPDC003709 TaxID=3154450 RepID=UPI0033BB960E